MKTIILIILALVLIASGTVWTYGGPYTLNRGIATHWGGLELYPQPAVFVCTQAPFAPLFPGLVADC